MSTDVVEKEYVNRMNTLATKLKVAKNKVMKSLLKVGEALEPTTNKILEQLSPMLDKFSKWIEKNPKLTSGIMRVVGAFSIFSLGLGGIQYLIVPLLRGIDTFKIGLEMIKLFKFGKKLKQWKCLV